MKLGFLFCMCVVACDQPKTDIGDLPAGTGTESGGDETGEPTTAPPIDCAGEDCLDGCCEGFGCNFANLCEACTPAGEFRGADGAGCCEGLLTAPSMLCYDSGCDDGACAPGTVCGGLTDATPQEHILECTPEVCVAEFTRTVAGAPGLECSGPSGSDDCAATGGMPQIFTHESEGLVIGLAFDAAILDGYSTDAFNQFFGSAFGEVVIPDAGAPLTALVDLGTVSAFVYSEGRLQFTVEIPLDEAFALIQFGTEECGGPIPGACPCFYEDLGTYQLVVDLPIESP